MRFLLNFFFYGLLFYLIWMFFPDAFATLVNWANHVVAYLRELISGISDKVHHQTAPVVPASALLLFHFLTSR